MSTAGLPLRRVDAARLAHEAAFRHGQALGLRMAWAPLPRHGSVLRFRQSGAQCDVTSLVPTTAWVARHWPSLAGLAWDMLDDASARALFDQPDAGPLEAPWLHGGTSHWLEYLHAAPPGELPCVDTDLGPVWIEALHADIAPAAARDLPPDLRLWIDFRLARIRLRLAQVRALRPGDVVLVDTLAPVALLERRALFSFALHEGHIMVIDFDAMAPFDDAADDEAEAAPADHDAAQAPRLELDQLTVTVEVVLCRLAQSLAALSDARPGTTIALPDGAHRSVELRVQGQLLATGELVGVGEGLGVQLTSRTDRK